MDKIQAILSLSPQRYDSQPAAIAAGCFRHTADASSLVDDVWRKQAGGPSGPAAVNHIDARTPRKGTEIAPAPGRRNLAQKPFAKSDEKTYRFSRITFSAAIHSAS